MSETFATFKTKVADWLVRPDIVDAVLSDFVNIALHKLEDDYDFRGSLKRTTIAVVAGADVLASPPDYARLSAAWFLDSSGKRWPLVKDSENHALTVSPNSTTDVSDIPKTISYLPVTASGITSLYFQLRPTPSVAGTIDIIYYATSPDLAAGSDTNYFLTGPWHILLYGALAEAADYSKDDEGIKKWTMKRNDAAQKVIQTELTEKFSGSYQTVKTGYSISGRPQGRR